MTFEVMREFESNWKVEVKRFRNKEEADKYYMRKIGFCKRVKQFDVWRIGNAEVEVG